MRGPGIEPGPQRWQRRILTTILPALIYKVTERFYKGLFYSPYKSFHPLLLDPSQQARRLATEYEKAP